MKSADNDNEDYGCVCGREPGEKYGAHRGEFEETGGERKHYSAENAHYSARPAVNHTCDHACTTPCVERHFKQMQVCKRCCCCTTTDPLPAFVKHHPAQLVRYRRKQIRDAMQYMTARVASRVTAATLDDEEANMRASIACLKKKGTVTLMSFDARMHMSDKIWRRRINGCCLLYTTTRMQQRRLRCAED